MERSYMSGSQKRKLKKARELEMKKAKGSFLKFLPQFARSEMHSTTSTSTSQIDLKDEKQSQNETEELCKCSAEPEAEDKLLSSNNNKQHQEQGSSTTTKDELNENEKQEIAMSLDDTNTTSDSKQPLENRELSENKLLPSNNKQHQEQGSSTTKNELNENENNFQEIVMPLDDTSDDKQPPEDQELLQRVNQREVLVDDPAQWHDVSDSMIEYFIKNPPPQNTDLVKDTAKVFGGSKRFLTKNNFFKVKKNGEKLRREWLVLSATEKKLFCWICKLFRNTSTSLSTSGFHDWKHVAIRLTEHENSFSHRESILKFSQRLNIKERIDSALIKQYQSEVHYWRSVLQRVVETVKFLSSRGMAFFGDNETFGSCHNGNFLGCLELIAQFDPFLAKHIEKAGNQGTGNVNYLSSTIVNEFIELMGNKVLDVVIKEVVNAKYFSIIVDSTPDITHMDQLTLILRYLDPDHEPVERFIKFIQIFGHSAEKLFNVILESLENLGLDILNCRGQSYDNAFNLAGKYTGVQARIKNINPTAEYVPCSAHSLNLVGTNAAESCTDAVNFFSLLQELYNFFSVSTYRWQIMIGNFKENKQKLTLKNRSCTRWCADANATKALHQNYASVLKSLSYLADDQEQTPSTRNEAKALYRKLLKLENAINTVVWDTILQRLNHTSKILQNSMAQLDIVSPLFESLVEFVQSVRNEFEKYEAEALELLPEGSTYEIKRKKITPRSRFLDDSNTPEVSLEPRDQYIINCHYVLCDSLILNLNNRKIPYEKLLSKFSCLINLKSNFQKKEAEELVKCYPSDLGDEFTEELQHFRSLVDKQATALDMMQMLKKLNLSSAFSNVETALHIFLSLPISNCTGERSFSVLKRLKSPMRSCIQQEKMCQLSMLCLNSDITRSIDYSDAVDSFAEKKIRKKPLKQKIEKNSL